MPLYTYRCPACKVQKTVIRSMKCDDAVLCDDCAFVMARDFKADFGKQYHGNTYPYASTAMGVHPEEVKHRMKFDSDMGVPTVYNDEGDPIMRNKTHRRKFCRAHGVHDRNAGHSDPVPD